MKKYEWKVAPEDAKQRLDVTIAKNTDISRRKAKTIIEEGGVYVNRKRVSRVSRMVRTGDAIQCYVDTRSSETLKQLSFQPDWIIYQDQGFIILNKPEGIYSQPTRASLKDCILYQVKKELNLRYLVPINRLDKLTSGIMITATNPYSSKILSSYMQNHQFEKQYCCVVEGIIHEDYLEIDKALEDVPKKIPKQYRVTEEPGAGKPSLTHVQVVERLDNKTVLKVFPKTGRTHQIRVHLAWIGYPVVGDPLYGKMEPETRMMLHAESLSFIHPQSNIPLFFRSPCPFLEEIDTLACEKIH